MGEVRDNMQKVNGEINPKLKLDKEREEEILVENLYTGKQYYMNKRKFMAKKRAWRRNYTGL